MGANRTYFPVVHASAERVPIFRTLWVDHIKKVRSSLSRLAEVQGRARFALQTTQFPLETVRFPQEPWSHLRRERNPLSPKLAQQGVAKYPRYFVSNSRRDLLDAIARASPMGKGRSMRPFPINEREQHYRFTQSGKIRGPARR